MALGDLKKLTFHFLVGSQDLYGDDVLRTVDAHAQEMAAFFNASALLPGTVVTVPVLRNSDGIERAVRAAENDAACAGVITWMHTFSPSKMWIRGLSLLTKPLLHLNTQFLRDIPWDAIDMDYMNLHQSAHGDREHGFILSRMRLPHKAVSGFWRDDAVLVRIGAWMRAAAVVAEGRRLRVLRISDNMREVAVTEGDKVEAHLRFGWSVDHYGVEDVIAEVERVTEAEVDAQMARYAERYAMRTDDVAAVRYQAREQVALARFLADGGFGAFHTNFQDLQQLRQLPGLAVQDLMREGYGFAGEGDWKTAAMVRVLKAMGAGRAGGASFMEDYTYHLEPGNEMVLGAHMLEVCPTIAAETPAIRVVPLGIGGREPPARLTFKCAAGPAVLASLVDMGERFRLVVNEVACVAQAHDMPKLPVAGVLWKPLPSLAEATEAWMLAGGAHHSALSYAVGAEELEDWAEMLGVECVRIGAGTDVAALKRGLAVEDAVRRIRTGR